MRLCSLWPLSLLVSCSEKPGQYPAYPDRLENGVHVTDQSDVERWQVEMRRMLARTVPATGYGSCASCHLPWWVVTGHTVDFSESGGCFPVCEMCWQNLDRDEIWPYYAAHIRKNYPGDKAKEETLRRNFAVER